MTGVTLFLYFCKREKEKDMKKILLGMAILASVTARAKTTYVPAYMSFIQIAEAGDTIRDNSTGRSLSLRSADGTFQIFVEHEDLSGERIKEIKRAKRAAGWMAVAAVVQGVSAAFSDNALQYTIRSNNTRVISELSAMYAGAAKADQTLAMDIWIENSSGHELLINDTDRGLTWYVQPHEALAISASNPDCIRLRISDLQHSHVRFATIAAGSSVDKAELKHEDADYWFITAYRRNADGTLEPLGGFERISKHDFSRELLNYKQLQEYIARHK